MPAAPFPANENRRLSALTDAAILYTPPEPVFDEIVHEAALAADTPIALLSFISDKTQWVKAAVGLEAEETSRDAAFCAWAIHSADVTWIEDATEDERFSDNPFVHGHPNIRHYAGAPISTPEGYLLGTLCVIDQVPRPHNPEVAERLRQLSKHVSEALKCRAETQDRRRLRAQE